MTAQAEYSPSLPDGRADIVAVISGCGWRWYVKRLSDGTTRTMLWPWMEALPAVAPDAPGGGEEGREQ